MFSLELKAQLEKHFGDQTPTLLAMLDRLGIIAPTLTAANYEASGFGETLGEINAFVQPWGFTLGISLYDGPNDTLHFRLSLRGIAPNGLPQ